MLDEGGHVRGNGADRRIQLFRGSDHRDRITGLGTPRSDGFLGGMRPLATS